MDVLEHPALTSVHADALQSRVDCVACGNIPHPRMAEASVTGLQFRYQFVNLFLKDFRVGAREYLIPAISDQCIPIHAVHSGIEMLCLHQSADFVENLRAFVESEIHCRLTLIGIEVSPTAMNAAQ